MSKQNKEELIRLAKNADAVRNIYVIGGFDSGKSTLMSNFGKGSRVGRYSFVSAVSHEPLMDDRLVEENHHNRKILNLLLCIRKFNSNSFWSDSTMPLDIFKVILFEARILPLFTTGPFALHFWKNSSQAPDSQHEMVMSDGALLVLNIVDGFNMHAEINFKELQLSHSEISNSVSNTFAQLNVIPATHSGPDLTEKHLVFGSALQGWGFNLTTFAKLYAKKFSVPEDKMLSRLWGQHYFDPQEKKWKTSPGPKALETGFCIFVLNPIMQIFKQASNPLVIKKICSAINVPLTEAELSSNDKELAKTILQRWLPLNRDLFQACTSLIQSPLHTGERVSRVMLSNQVGKSAQAMRMCTDRYDLMVYVSQSGPQGATIGRVFSGILRKSQRVAPLDQNSSSQKLSHREKPQTQKLEKLCWFMGDEEVEVSAVYAGNLVAIAGFGALNPATTLSSLESQMSPLMSPFPQLTSNCSIEIEPVVPSSLPAILKVAQKIRDPLTEVEMNATGKVRVRGCNELHLEVFLKDLETYIHKSDPSLTSPVFRCLEPLVDYRQSITEDSNEMTFSFLAQYHVTARAKLMDFEFSLVRSSVSDAIENANFLTEGSQVWSFGPPISPFNCLVSNTARSFRTYLHTDSNTKEETSIQDILVTSFLRHSQAGILTGAPWDAICIELKDVQVPLVSSKTQFLSVCDRMFSGLQLESPQLKEPVFLCEVMVPENHVGAVYMVMNRRRGVIIEERMTMKACNIRAYIPASESFGLAADLRSATSGHGFLTSCMDHWQPVRGDINDPTSLSASIMQKLRSLNGLSPVLPSLSSFKGTLNTDKLSNKN